MENQQRPGMPEIVPSGDPQPFTSGPAGAPSGSATSFAAEFMAASGAQAQPPTPPPAPSVPQPKVVVTPPSQDPQPAPQPAVPPSFDRYGAPPPDPLSNLEQLPSLEPQGEVAQPQGMGDKANYAFAELKSKWHASRKQAEEAIAKYNALVESTKGFVDQKSQFADQLNAKDAKIKELEDDLGRIELSRSSAFREKYDAPLDQTCAEIASVLEQNGVPKEEAQQRAYQIVTMSADQVGEAISNLPVMAQGEIGIRARGARKILADREAELNDWRQSQAGLAEVEARGGDLRHAQHMAEMADKAVELVRALTPENGQIPAFAVVDQEFAASRDERASRFKDWLARAPEDQRFAAMFEGFMAPKTYEMLQQTMVENMQLKRALQSRAGFQAPPSVPVHVEPAPPPPPPPPPKEPFGEAMGATDATAFAGEFMRQMLS